MLSIILLSLAGVVIAMVVGTFWHMPSTPAGKVHMQFIGFDKLSPEEQKRKMEEAKPSMPKIYAGQALLSFLSAIAVVLIVTMSIRNGLPPTMALAFITFNWLCFMVPVIGGNVLWGPCEGNLAWKKFFFDIAYNFIVVFLVALLASAFA